jgi:hypothetical protein
METNNVNPNDSSYRSPNNSGRVFGGIVLLLIGLAFFAREAGIYFPHWLFSWPMILVAIGLLPGGLRRLRQTSRNSRGSSR